MNLNDLAREIAELEGGKQNLSIAQIKEVVRCLGDILHEMHVQDFTATIAKLAKKK